MPRPREVLMSECGQRIANRNQAIAHAAACCSVGRVVDPEMCPSCGQPVVSAASPIDPNGASQ